MERAGTRCFNIVRKIIDQFLFLNREYMKATRQLLLIVILVGAVFISQASAYYTTKGQDIIDSTTGEKVLLKGFGIGCWLLPEGYMWGIRKLDRPRLV